LEFSDGRISKIDPYMPEHFFDGDAFFLGYTFLQMLFRYRTMDELNFAHIECFAKGGDIAVLLQALFLKKNQMWFPYYNGKDKPNTYPTL